MERQSKTIVVGAGLNAHIYGAHSYLSSWNNFLEHFYLMSMNRDIPGSLSMEEKIRDISNFSEEARQAHEWEGKILKEMKSEMSQKTDAICDDSFEWILTDKTITDIICLNFNPPFNLKWSDLKHSKRPKEVVNNNREFRNNCEFYHLKNKLNCTIRFWFPHGVSKSIDSMVLGTHRYCAQTSVIADLFSQIKQREVGLMKKNESAMSLKSKILRDPFSWLEPFIVNELYFLGCSLSHAEWDLWSALALRRRNFAKLENRKYENPIFHMRHGCKQASSYPQFIQPLYDPSMSYSEQWEKLKEGFSKSKI
jgi:hypothetical protein